MASANNWHGFSPSPQTSINASHETSPAQPAAGHLSGKDADGYGTGVNFRPDGCSFSGVNALSSTPQGWSMKSFEFKGSASELSMLVDSSGGKYLHGMNNVIEGKPKLEDFLGAASDSFSGHHETTMADHLHSNCCSALIPGVSSNNGGNGSMGVSMVKTWLRNQPAPSESVLECLGGSTQCLALSMSRSALSQSSSPCEKGARTLRENGGGLSCGIDGQAGALESVQRKSTDTFGQRTSIYRGVTRHRWTGRYEAHLWDSSCRREGQTRKGRQVYLGGYDREEKAARAYDLAAIKYWGAATTTNFPVSNYEEEVEQMKRMSRQEYVASLRRKSSGFSRGASIYRGVTRHHQNGRWQARIGRVAGNKDLYLGTFGTQEEAAEAYDIAAIKFRGLNAVTNFDMSRYDVKSILESSSLPFGGAAKRLKDVFDHSKMDRQLLHGSSSSSAFHFPEAYVASSQHHVWPTIAFQHPLHVGLPYYNLHTTGEQRGWYKPEPDAATGQGIQSIERQIQFQSTTHNFFGIQTMEGVESSGYGWSGNMISMRAKMAGGATAVGGGGGGIENSQVKTGMEVNMLAGDSDAYYPISVSEEGGYDAWNDI